MVAVVVVGVDGDCARTKEEEEDIKVATTITEKEIKTNDNILAMMFFSEVEECYNIFKIK